VKARSVSVAVERVVPELVLGPWVAPAAVQDLELVAQVARGGPDADRLEQALALEQGWEDSVVQGLEGWALQDSAAPAAPACLEGKAMRTISAQERQVGTFGSSWCLHFEGHRLLIILCTFLAEVRVGRQLQVVADLFNGTAFGANPIELGCLMPASQAQTLLIIATGFPHFTACFELVIPEFPRSISAKEVAERLQPRY
jgi:hypothetical protein